MSRYKGWFLSAVVLLLAIAAYSRVAKMDEPAKLIRGGANALTDIFKGVLR